MTDTRTRNRIEQEMEKNARNYRRRIEDIRADQDLTLEAKKRRMQEVYEEARSQHGQLYDQQRQELRSRVERLRRESLAPPTKFGSDKETVQLSYRDALSRVADVDDRRTLSDMLQRAAVTGDATLGKAILYRAYELEDNHVVGSYLEHFPHDRSMWDRFMDSAQEFNDLEEQGRMFGDLGPEPPRELGGAG